MCIIRFSQEQTRPKINTKFKKQTNTRQKKLSAWNKHSDGHIAHTSVIGQKLHFVTCAFICFSCDHFSSLVKQNNSFPGGLDGKCWGALAIEFFVFITVENDVIIKSPRRSVKTVWPCFFFDVLIGPVEPETLKLCQFSYRSLPISPTKD